MNLKRKVRKALKKISISDIPLSLDEFKTIELHQAFNNCFNKAASLALVKKSYGVIHEWNNADKGYYLEIWRLETIFRKLKFKNTECFSCITIARKYAVNNSFVFFMKKKRTVAYALEKLIKMINDISKRGIIRGSICPFFICKTSTGYFVGSYLALEQNDLDLVKSLYKGYHCNEGAMPTELF